MRPMSCRAARTAALALAALPVLQAQEPPQGAGGPPPTQNQLQGESGQTATAPPVTAPQQKGIVLQIGDTTVKFGGYVKVDLIHDFNQIGSPDSFDPRTIPTTGG